MTQNEANELSKSLYDGIGEKYEMFVVSGKESIAVIFHSDDGKELCFTYCDTDEHLRDFLGVEAK